MKSTPRPRADAGRLPVLASLVPVLAGLAASAVLAVDYLQPAPVFCSEGGGCEAVRQTALAAVLGVPTPLVGLAGFVALGAASLLPGRRARIAQLVLAVPASVVGMVLLAAQWAIGHYCPYCCVADASAIASAFVASWRFVVSAEASHEASAEATRQAVDPSEPGSPPRSSATSPPRSSATYAYAGALAMLVAALAPVGIGMRLAARAPEVIRAEMASTPAGEVTVVDFVDFECPFCRMTNTELQPLLEAHRSRLRVVRRQVPLRMHPHALDAARAACCGEQLGKGEAMAEALFSAPVDDLTREGCEKIAQAVGLSVDPYRACVADPKTDESIQADRATFKAAGGYALPTLWIDGQQLVGSQPRAALEKAIGSALARAGS